jgi:hypothetical protein
VSRESEREQSADTGESVDSQAESDAGASGRGTSVDPRTGIEESADESGRQRDRLDRAAESFVEIEQELDRVPDGTLARGLAVDVERVPAANMPADFPVEITTEDALCLELSTRESTEQVVETYFEWPEDGTDDRLGRLLALHDIPADAFADLHGTELLLRAENGHWLPVVPNQQPRGDDRAFYGIVAGLAPSIAIALFSFFGLGGVVGTPAFLVLWLVCTFVVLPVSIYLDAWHLRTTTDWTGGPLFWAVLSMIPPLSVVVAPYYLIMRENAHPLT